MSPRSTKICAGAVVMLGLAGIWNLMRPAQRPVAPGPVPITTLLSREIAPADALHARLTNGPVIDLSSALRADPRSFSPLDPVLSIEATLEDALTTETSADAPHAMGILRLNQERLDEAIDLLMAASLLDLASAEIRTDLAAGLLERGIREGSRLDLLDALEASRDALDAAAESPEALYNFALAADELGLEHQAMEAWNRYLEVDAASPWADEARGRLASLNLTASDQTWEVLEDETLQAIETGDLEEARALVATQSATARKEVAESLLGRWATAKMAGNDLEADTLLALARVVAEVGETRDGDRLLKEVTLSIDRAEEIGGGSLRTAVLGYRGVQEGIALRRSARCQRAQPYLAEAARRLSETGSPLAELARLNWAICLFYSDAATTAAFLIEMSTRLESLPYPWLRGQVEWMVGLALAAGGETWSAIDRYQRAAALFEQTNDPSSAQGVRTLAAEAYRSLGEQDLAWQLTLDSIVSLGEAGDVSSLDRVLDDAAHALADEGRYEAALLFQREQLEYAERSGAPDASMASTFPFRAALLRQTEQHDAALDVIREGRTLCADLPDGPERERIESELTVEEALVLARIEPARALRQFEQGLDAFEATGYQTRFPELFLARGQARAALGDLAGADEDISRALDELEWRHAGTESEETRIAATEDSQAAYDAAMRFHALDQEDPRRAFETAERSKGRALRRRAGLDQTLPHLEDVQELIPEGAALLEYAVLPDALYIWAVTRDRIRFVSRPIPGDELRDRTTLFLRLLSTGGANQATISAAGDLFQLLIDPIRPVLEESRTLVIVPDRFLVALPFRALYDRETGQFLLETHRTALTPSAALLVPNDHPRGLAAREIPSLLAVGNPGLDRERFPDLEELRWAEIESRRAAEMYSSALLLTREDATPRAFLEALERTSVLHLAAHSRRKEGHGSEILLAAEAGEGASGALDLGTVEPRSLRSLDTAFLSICSAATSSPYGGREGVDGPVRALLAAGVPATVASLWRIDDRDTTEIALEFHHRIVEGESPADALRESQLQLLRSAPDEGATPGRWAAFELFVTQWP